MNFKSQTLVSFIILYVFCETGEFRPLTVDKLKTCSACPSGWGVAQRCTKTSDTVCHRCAPGKTYSSLHSTDSACWPCSKCGVGLFEAHTCTPQRDTVCNECLSYFDHKNFTQPNDFTDKCSYMFLQR